MYLFYNFKENNLQNSEFRKDEVGSNLLEVRIEKLKILIVKHELQEKNIINTGICKIKIESQQEKNEKIKGEDAKDRKKK